MRAKEIMHNSAQRRATRSVTVFAKTRFTWEPQETDSFASWESNTSTAPCNQPSQSAGERGELTTLRCEAPDTLLGAFPTRESPRELTTLRCLRSTSVASGDSHHDQGFLGRLATLCTKLGAC